MTKMIVSGFTDILTDCEEAISFKNVLEIDRIRNNNIIFTVCSNNNFKYIYDYNNDFIFMDYIISNTGAYVYDLVNERILFKKNILPSIIKKLYKKYNSTCTFCTLDNNYVFENDNDFDKFYNENKNSVYSVIIDINSDDYLDTLNINYIKLNRNIYIVDSHVSLDNSINKICLKRKIDLKNILGIGFDDYISYSFKNINIKRGEDILDILRKI